MFKKRLSKILVTSLILMPTMVVTKTSAQTIEQKNVTPTKINLAFNHGVTIMLDSKSIVRTIWLDNPTFAVLSFDKCVAGFNGCQESNARRIHLKRIQDLKLKNVPPANNTLMTVITENSETEIQDIHLFTLTKASRSSSPLIAIKSESQTNIAKTNPVLSASGMTPEKLADKITATLANPQVKEKIGNAEQAKLKQFANLLMLGTPEYQAMNLTGISPELIKSIVTFKYAVKP
ncbi:MAG: hypothetical protein WBM44_24540 [Waterburya sp.]